MQSNDCFITHNKSFVATACLVLIGCTSATPSVSRSVFSVRGAWARPNTPRCQQHQNPSHRSSGLFHVARRPGSLDSVLSGSTINP